MVRPGRRRQAKAAFAFLVVATLVTIDFLELWGLDIAVVLFVVGGCSIGLLVGVEKVREWR